MPYCHLTVFEREEIVRLREAGHSLSSIGRMLGRDKGTISRELRRNLGGDKKYSCVWAQLQYAKRRRFAKLHQRPKLIGHLLAYVKRKLLLRWSPEQIAGRLRDHHGRDLSCRVSHVTIYRWIRQDKAVDGDFHKYLRQSSRRRRKKYGSSLKGFSIPGKVSIDERPKVVDQRKRFGDWEGDLVLGKDRSSYVLTLVERKSGYLLLKRISKKLAATVRNSSIALLRKIPPRYRKTLTFDNGTEFSDFKRIETALGINVYFAHPYSSWERGTNENTNGLLRQYLPKGLDLRHRSNKHLAKITREINNRPRKRLNYRTPREALPA